MPNLATMSNFVEFRDSQNFTFFEAPGVVRDTWHIVSDSRGATCHVQNESNMSSNGTHERHVATCDWVKIHGRWISGYGVILRPMRITHVASEGVTPQNLGVR